jgi:hypothetical protein
MLDKFYALRKFRFFKLVVIYLRYLIGFAFVFASFIKIQGERFTMLPTTNPVGYFFEAMYQTGFYWNFLGWSQFIAGTLLMTQRFATVGAMAFFPIILNVFMITQSIDFGMGTPVITTLMLLGTIFLLLWDYKKWIILFQRDHTIHIDLTKEPEDQFMNDPIWIFAGCSFVFLLVILNLIGIKDLKLLGILFPTIGVTAFVYAMVKYRRKKSILKMKETKL